MSNLILLSAAAVVFPAVWGFVVWWVLDRTWTNSPGAGNGSAAIPSESSVPDFQI